MNFSKKAIFKFIFGEVSISLDIIYPFITKDTSWTEAIIGAIPIPGTSLIHLFGDKEDEEENGGLDNEGADPENEFRENGKRVMTDGGQRNRNESETGRRRLTDPSRLSTQDSESILNKAPIGKNFLVGLLALAAIGLGFYFIGFMGIIGAIAIIGLGYFVYSSFGMKGVLGLSIPFIFLIGVFGFTGYGSGYGLLISDTVGDPLDGAFGDAADELGYQVGRGVAFFQCAGDAGCLREWRLNSTSDLGTESVGKTFEVSMIGPEVTGANDVSVRPKNDKIPVYFGLINSRHGVRGVDAENVKYRMKVTNPGVPFVDGSTPVCETDWKNISKYPNLDSDEIDNFDSIDRSLFPGQTFDWEDQSESMTLFNCGLMNPGAQGNKHEAKVEVKYDYSTFSIMEVEAMADESHEGSRDEKKSESVDTPARTAITTRTAPMTYRKLDGRTISDPLTVRVWLETDEDDTKFKVDAEKFYLKDSSLTTHIQNNCRGLKQSEKDEDKYKLSNDIIKQIEDRQDRGDEGWFSQRSKTPTATCDFKLENPERISETGETVSFRARANYTVRFQKESSGFSLFNGNCDIENCPYVKPINSSNLKTTLVNELDLDEDKPLHYKDGNGEDENWGRIDYWKKEYAKCNRPLDSENSCSWVDTFNYGERDPSDESIEKGEFAIRFNDEPDEADEFFACGAEEQAEGNVVGIEEEELNEAYSDSESGFRYEGGEWRFESGFKCESNDSDE